MLRASTSRSSLMPRLPLTRRTSPGVAAARTASASAAMSSVWKVRSGASPAATAPATRLARARPEAEEPGHRHAGRRGPHATVQAGLARPELEHVAEHRQGPAPLGAGQLGQGAQRRLHGGRVGVVAVVHQQQAARQPLQPQPPSHRAHRRQAADDLLVGAAERDGGAGGGGGVLGVVGPDQRQRDGRARGCRRRAGSAGQPRPARSPPAPPRRRAAAARPRR